MSFEIKRLVEITIDEEGLKQMIIDRIAENDPDIIVSDISFTQKLQPKTHIRVSVKAQMAGSDDGLLLRGGGAPKSSKETEALEAVAELDEDLADVDPEPVKPKAKAKSKSKAKKPVETLNMNDVPKTSELAEEEEVDDTLLLLGDDDEDDEPEGVLASDEDLLAEEPESKETLEEEDEDPFETALSEESK